MKYAALIVFTALFLFSCEKKELPVPKRVVPVRTGGISMPGELIEMQIGMGSDYRNQIWFSLNDSRIVASNLKIDWDLAFECSAGGFHVMLNGSKAMKAHKTNFTALAEVTSTVGIGEEKADMPSGNTDSTAIGNWMEQGNVYVINRGYDEAGKALGFYKLKLLTVNASQFTFEYSDIKNPQVFQGVVKKDEACNFTGYSFSTHKQCENIEPKKQSYDLCFTQYTHLFIEEKQYYQVTGVLTNSYNTRVMRITDKAFSEISINDTLGRSFSVRRDKIGYDWKEFNLNTNIYKVDPSICYLISDNKNFFYKLHFTGFVNSSGLKGYPAFEFQKL